MALALRQLSVSNGLIYSKEYNGTALTEIGLPYDGTLTGISNVMGAPSSYRSNSTEACFVTIHSSTYKLNYVVFSTGARTSVTLPDIPLSVLMTTSYIFVYTPSNIYRYTKPSLSSTTYSLLANEDPSYVKLCGNYLVSYVGVVNNQKVIRRDFNGSTTTVSPFTNSNYFGYLNSTESASAYFSGVPSSRATYQYDSTTNNLSAISGLGTLYGAFIDSSYLYVSAMNSGSITRYTHAGVNSGSISLGGTSSVATSLATWHSFISRWVLYLSGSSTYVEFNPATFTISALPSLGYGELSVLPSSLVVANNKISTIV